VIKPLGSSNIGAAVADTGKPFVIAVNQKVTCFAGIAGGRISFVWRCAVFRCGANTARELTNCCWMAALAQNKSADAHEESAPEPEDGRSLRLSAAERGEIERC